MNSRKKNGIRLKYGCAPDNGIQWKLQDNRRFSICGLHPGNPVVLSYVSGKRLFSTVTTHNEFSITISHSKSGCIVLSRKDRKQNILKRSFISVSKREYDYSNDVPCTPSAHESHIPDKPDSHHPREQ